MTINLVKKTTTESRFFQNEMQCEDEKEYIKKQCQAMINACNGGN
jgi:hypothetical protein